ncbi:unnamed protein product [Amoebophrya sp. A25]|nr:unnamed protein product [Amoebophrya sp. A25]|eukprot:GSA25T00005331001.1
MMEALGGGNGTSSSSRVWRHHHAVVSKGASIEDEYDALDVEAGQAFGRGAASSSRSRRRSYKNSSTTSRPGSPCNKVLQEKGRLLSTHVGREIGRARSRCQLQRTAWSKVGMEKNDGRGEKFLAAAAGDPEDNEDFPNLSGDDDALVPAGLLVGQDEDVALLQDKVDRSSSEDEQLLKGDNNSDEDLSEEEDDEEEEILPVSFWGTVANQVLAGLGTGILTLPVAVGASGLLNYVFLCAFMLWLNYVSVMILVRASERYRVFDLEKLMKLLTGGKVWYWVCSFTLRLSYELVLISYLMGGFLDNASNFLREFARVTAPTVPSTLERFNDMRAATLERERDDISYAQAMLSRQVMEISAVDTKWKGVDFGTWKLQPWMLISIAAVLVTPLCFFPQKWLSYTSYFSIGVNMFVLIMIFVNFGLERSNLQGHERGFWYASQDICLFGVSPGNIGVVSALTMAMSVQPCMPPMYQELENRSPEKFGRTMKISSMFLFVLFVCFAMFGQFTYGDEVQENILNNLPSGVWYSTMIRVTMSLVVLCVYPLILYPMRVGFKSTTAKAFWTVGPIVVSLVMAIFFNWLDKSLGTLNNLSGAVSAFFFLCLFPAILGAELNEGIPYWREWNTWRSWKYWLYILLGLFFMVAGVSYPEPTLDFRVWSTTSGQQTPDQSSAVQGPFQKFFVNPENFQDIAFDEEFRALLTMGQVARPRNALVMGAEPVVRTPKHLVSFGNAAAYRDLRIDVENGKRRPIPSFYEYKDQILRVMRWTKPEPADAGTPAPLRSAPRTLQHALPATGKAPAYEYESGTLTWETTLLEQKGVNGPVDDKPDVRVSTLDPITYALLLKRALEKVVDDSRLKTPRQQEVRASPTFDRLAASIKELFRQIAKNENLLQDLERSRLTEADLYAVYRQETKGYCDDRCKLRANNDQPEFRGPEEQHATP